MTCGHDDSTINIVMGIIIIIIIIISWLGCSGLEQASTVDLLQEG